MEDNIQNNPVDQVVSDIQKCMVVPFNVWQEFEKHVLDSLPGKVFQALQYFLAPAHKVLEVDLSAPNVIPVFDSEKNKK